MEDSKVKIILEAARKRFAHYGISKTTMNEIAADIGMSKASLYYYFPDKENLFVAVAKQDFDAFVNTIDSLITKPSKAAFKLKKFAGMRNELLNKVWALAKIELSTVSEVMKPVFTQHRQNLLAKEKELIIRIFELGIEEGSFIKFNTSDYADLLIASLNGLRSQNIAANLTIDAEFEEKTELQGQLLLDIFLKSIRKA